MSKIQVFHHSNSFASDEQFHKMTEDFGESNTDKSFFRPDVSSTRSSLGSLQGSSLVGQYDFKDGKDTGDVIMTILRSKSLDKTELDRLEALVKENIDNKKKIDADNLEKLKNAENAKEFEKVIKQIEQNTASSVKKSSSSTEASTN